VGTKPIKNAPTYPPLIGVLLSVGCITWATPAHSTPPPNLEGEWAQIQVHASQSSLPVVGRINSTTTSYLHLRVRQQGNTLRLAITPCAVQVDTGVSTVRTIIPQAFLDAIGTTHTIARLEKVGQNWVWDQAPTISVTGAVLDNLWRDVLPESEDDPRVFDADSDGRPGVTVHIRGLIEGSIFLVQRSWTALKGEVNGDTITGLVRWNTSQKVLGATSIFLRSETETRPHPDPQKSHFFMRRITTGTQCADIVKTPKLQ